MADHVFSALSDPTRRHLYGTLARSGPATATSLAAELVISRQAVAKHLGVLADAGMASSTRVGREIRFEAKLEPLTSIEQWINSIESEWTNRLTALAASLEDQSPDQ